MEHLKHGIVASWSGEMERGESKEDFGGVLGENGMKRLQS